MVTVGVSVLTLTFLCIAQLIVRAWAHRAFQRATGLRER